MKEYVIDLPGGTNEFAVEFTEGEDKTPKLKAFISSLDFVRETEEFKTVELQRYLKCGYGTVCKVIDALCMLNVIEKIENSQSNGGLRYRRIIR